MIPVVFAAFIVLSAVVALSDWRRGWYLALLCGVLQDPARKLTAGTPVVMTFSIIIIYGFVIIASQATLQRYYQEARQRFSPVYAAGILVLFFLALAAINGLFTFGLSLWTVPALSLFIYLIPIPAMLLGYAFVREESDLWKLLTFYAVITSIALIGGPLEYKEVHWRALGTVALTEANIRMITGFSIRMLSGFYRGPDIMAWHAAMLTMIGALMALRARFIRNAWPWLLVSAWGLLNCFISGRRKAVYMVAVYVLVFVWRYARRLSAAQVVSFAALALIAGAVVHNLGATEESSVYTRGAVTTREEVFGRLEGGLSTTIQQFGLLGAGLGTATQGIRHITGRDTDAGWQEGGLGKLAIELGVPGLIAAIFLGAVAINFMLKISRHPDVPGSSQLLRAGLVAILMANMIEFMVSAQAYSDAVLTLMTAFLGGCCFATAVLDERVAAAELAAVPVPVTA